MSDVFVAGALHLDVVVDAPRLPMLDETLFGQSVAYRFGGKGGNQALAAARMGASVAMAGRVGDDAFAAAVLAELETSGVDHAQVLQVTGATGMSVAIVEAGGEYGAVVVSGVNRTIDAGQVDPGGARVLLLQNEIDETVNLAVARRRDPSARVILNAAPARPVSPELLRQTDLLIVNRVEAAQMTGADVIGLDVEAAATELASFGPDAVVVTAGADGALLVEDGKQEWILPPVRAEGSAHGAGDAFAGALAAEISRGCGLKDAVRFASASAAHFIGTPPELRSEITRTDVNAWIQKQQEVSATRCPTMSERPRTSTHRP